MIRSKQNIFPIYNFVNTPIIPNNTPLRAGGGPWLWCDGASRLSTQTTKITPANPSRIYFKKFSHTPYQWVVHHQSNCKHHPPPSFASWGHPLNGASGQYLLWDDLRQSLDKCFVMEAASLLSFILMLGWWDHDHLFFFKTSEWKFTPLQDEIKVSEAPCWRQSL